MLQKLKQIATTCIPIYKSVAARKKYDRVLQDILTQIDASQTDQTKNIKAIVTNNALDGSVRDVLRYWLSGKDYTHLVPSETAEMQLRCTFEVAKRLTQSLSSIVGIQPIGSPVGLIYRMRRTFAEDQPDTLTFSMLTNAVVTKSHKLSAHWTLEAAEDMRGMFGLDIVTEISNIVASEICQEITNEVLNDLRKLAEFKREVTKDQAVDAAFHMGSEIAQSTRRGIANFMVVSGDTLDLFKSVIKPLDSASSNTNGCLVPVGTINRGLVTINVYLDTFAPDSNILVGYKGTSDFDAGYVLSPYKAFMVTPGHVIHPETYQPYIPTVSKFGTTHNSIYGNYYGLITVKRDEH